MKYISRKCISALRRGRGPSDLSTIQEALIQSILQKRVDPDLWEMYKKVTELLRE